MPANEVKRRKNNRQIPDQEEVVSSEEASSSSNCRDETPQQHQNQNQNQKKSSLLDLRSMLCVLSVAACAFLTWVVLQQNERFSQMEDKYVALQGQTARLFTMEEEVLKVSKKLAASEDHLREALSAEAATAAALRRDVAALHAAAAAARDDADNSASRRELDAVNSRFLEVTEEWRTRLGSVHADLAELKAEAAGARTAAADGVNEAERRQRALGERLDELEDSTRRNARALERTEEEDLKRARDQLDWNTGQIHKLHATFGELARSQEETGSRLQDYLPKAEQCQEQLPQVEEAVRTILKLAGELSAAERRLDEVTMQVYGTEDSMLKSLNEIAAIRQELDELALFRAGLVSPPAGLDDGVQRMKDELRVVKEAISELTAVLRSGRMDGGEEEEEEEGWMEAEPEEEEEEEEEEAWNDADRGAETLSQADGGHDDLE